MESHTHVSSPLGGILRQGNFAVNMAVKWLAFFTSYFVGTWFEFLYVNQPGVRFLSLVTFLCIRAKSVISITYRKIGHGQVLQSFVTPYITRKWSYETQNITQNNLMFFRPCIVV